MDNEVKNLPAVTDQSEIAQMMQEIMSPVMNALAQMVKNNTEALQRLAASQEGLAVAQKIQADRMEALEKQIRLNTPVAPAQVRMLNGLIRQRAVELLSGWEEETENTVFRPQDDRKKINRVAALIRRHMLSRYGAGSVSEIPRHEYTVAVGVINDWNERRTVRDIARQ